MESWQDESLLQEQIAHARTRRLLAEAEERNAQDRLRILRLERELKARCAALVAFGGPGHGPNADGPQQQDGAAADYGDGGPSPRFPVGPHAKRQRTSDTVAHKAPHDSPCGPSSLPRPLQGGDRDVVPVRQDHESTDVGLAAAHRGPAWSPAGQPDPGRRKQTEWRPVVFLLPGVGPSGQAAAAGQPPQTQAAAAPTATTAVASAPAPAASPPPAAAPASPASPPPALAAAPAFAAAGAVFHHDTHAVGRGAAGQQPEPMEQEHHAPDRAVVPAEPLLSSSASQRHADAAASAGLAAAPADGAIMGGAAEPSPAGAAGTAVAPPGPAAMANQPPVQDAGQRNALCPSAHESPSGPLATALAGGGDQRQSPTSHHTTPPPQFDPAAPRASPQTWQHLQDLQLWLNLQHTAARPAGTNADSAAEAGESASGIRQLEVDLGGHTLLDDPYRPLLHGLLRLPSGTRLVNGRLEGCCILVEAGAQVELERLHVLGCPGQLPGGSFGRPDSSYLDLAVLAVSGSGSRAVVKGCTLAAGPNAGPGTDCVLVQKGGQLQMSGCNLSGARCAGLLVEDEGSLAAADGTTSRGNCRGGFVASRGGRLEVRQCIAKETGKAQAGGTADSGFGFIAQEAGQLLADRGCLADGNTADGFAASGKGSLLRIARDCKAMRNALCGFRALLGGRMEIGSDCRADANTRVGFLAECGSTVHAGANCVALNNRNGGFAASGAGARLTVGPNGRAQTNSHGGFCAERSAVLEAQEGCVSLRNGRGFSCEGRGSRIEAGRGCRAEGSNDCGFLALNGGAIAAGPDCAAVGNKAEGFAAVSGKITLGQGCRAEGNVSDGFTAALSETACSEAFPECGSMIAEAGGCVAKGNGKDGFCCEDAGCTMLLGLGCRATGNKGSGFVAKDGGSVRLFEGTEARSNGEWGLLALGQRSQLFVVDGWQGFDNELGPTAGNIRVAATAEQLRRIRGAVIPWA